MFDVHLNKAVKALQAEKEALRRELDEAKRQLAAHVGCRPADHDHLNDNTALAIRETLREYRDEAKAWADAAQAVVDLFDPAKPKACPAVLRAVATGAKRANESLRSRLARARAAALGRSNGASPHAAAMTLADVRCALDEADA